MKRILTAGVLSLAMVAGCSGKKAANQGIVEPLADTAVIMEFNGGKITAGDVKDLVNPRLKSMNEEAIETYKRGAERMLITKLLEAEAKKQNLASPEALMMKQIEGVSVTDADIKKFITENK